LQCPGLVIEDQPCPFDMEQSLVEAVVMPVEMPVEAPVEVLVEQHAARELRSSEPEQGEEVLASRE
jgi:hypothetical protein